MARRFPAPVYLSMKSQSGATTLLEMLIVLMIMGILATFVLINVNAVENKRRARDLTRITDLSVLMQAIEEYQIDHGNQLPGESARTYQSDQRPDRSACAPNCANISAGWLGTLDLGDYMATSRADPVNEGSSVYRYRHDGIRYKLDCILEAQKHKSMMEDDGGNDTSHYEMGTGTDTISF